jgi:PAS domain S-box-containing protein
MKKDQDPPADALRGQSGAELRRCVEERLSEKQRSQRSEIRDQRTTDDTQRLVHELRVHQIELEMQNEQLQQARAKAETFLAQYTGLYEFAPIGYMTLDREGTIRDVNLTGVRLLGVERPQLVKRRFGQFVAESDRRAFSDFLQKVFASEDKECCVVTLPREDSQPLVVQVEGTRSADGQECRAVVLDITGRRQAEEQTRAAQAETQRLLVLSEQSRRALLNEAEDEKEATEAQALQTRIANIFLTVPDDEMFDEVLKVILDVIHSPFGVFGYLDETGALVVPTMTQQIRDKCRVPDKTIRFPRETWEDSSWPRAILEKRSLHSNVPSVNIPAGHVGIQRHISLPILFQGEAIGLFQVANKEADYVEADVRTLGAIAGHVAPLLNARLQRERAQEALRRLNVELGQRVRDRTAELEVANQELETFSYSVSHDLRAPLRSIDGFSRILLEDYRDKLDDEGKDSLKRVRAASQRMGELIDDLLKLSHASRTEIRRAEVDLTALASEVAAELTRAEPTRSVHWVIAPGLVATGDPQLLREVIENLLGNAWKFTGKRTDAVIEIGATNAEGMGAFFVRDNGAGFDMAYVGKLFGAFQRLHSTTDFPGTGIGLATVQRIIHRHGGRVWAESEGNRGATFYFTLGAKE